MLLGYLQHRVGEPCVLMAAVVAAVMEARAVAVKRKCVIHVDDIVCDANCF